MSTLRQRCVRARRLMGSGSFLSTGCEIMRVNRSLWILLALGIPVSLGFLPGVAVAQHPCHKVVEAPTEEGTPGELPECPSFGGPTASAIQGPAVRFLGECNPRARMDGNAMGKADLLLLGPGPAKRD